DVGAIDYKQLILLIKNHSRGSTIVGSEGPDKAAIAVKHLYTLYVSNIYAAAAIDRNRHRGPKLARLIPCSRKLVYVFTVRRELEHSIIKSSQRINVSHSIYRDAHIKFRSIRDRTDRGLYRSNNVAISVKPHNVVSVCVP